MDKLIKLISCGCSLKFGTITIGVLDILFGLGNLIFGITAATEASHSVDEDSKKELVAESTVAVVLGAILLPIAICLIIGALNGKPTLLMPWMVYTIVFLAMNTVLFIVEVAQYFAINDTTNSAGNLVAALIIPLFQAYFLHVVYRLYKEQKGTAPPTDMVESS